MTAADPRAAIAAYLIDTVGDLVDGHVFRPRLPDKADLAGMGVTMPAPVLVVRAAGGYARFGGSDLPIGDPRVDVLCYGETRLEADNIAGEVLLALKALGSKVYERTYLRSARISGVVPLVDPDTAWNYSVVSAQVLCNDYASV